MASSYTLGAHFDRLIEHFVEIGRYADNDDVIRDGLRLVEEREKKLAALDAALARGLADAEAEHVHRIDEVRSRWLDASTGV